MNPRALLTLLTLFAPLLAASPAAGQGLFEEEVLETARSLEPFRGAAAIDTDWGNVFLPTTVARRSVGEVMADDAVRRMMSDDLLGALTQDVLERNYLYQLFAQYRPDAVVDCINTATAFAYRSKSELQCRA